MCLKNLVLVASAIVPPAELLNHPHHSTANVDASAAEAAVARQAHPHLALAVRIAAIVDSDPAQTTRREFVRAEGVLGDERALGGSGWEWNGEHLRAQKLTRV